MICAVPATATINIAIPSGGSATVGARSMFAPTILKPAKVVSSFSGPAPSSSPDTITAADLAPPSVQAYPVQAVAQPGMSMATKVGIFAGLVAVVGIGIVVATKHR
jgi:hypothetical protein